MLNYFVVLFCNVKKNSELCSVNKGVQHRRATKTENEMKKILTKTDIKAIVKAYELSEAEQDELVIY